MSDNRLPVTVRISPDAKAFFERAAAEAGLEPSIAARQVIELTIAHMRQGVDFIDTLGIIKRALKQASPAQNTAAKAQVAR